MELSCTRSAIVIARQQVRGSGDAQREFEVIFGLLFDRTHGKHPMMRRPRPIRADPSGSGLAVA